MNHPSNLRLFAAHQTPSQRGHKSKNGEVESGVHNDGDPEKPSKGGTQRFTLHRRENLRDFQPRRENGDQPNREAWLVLHRECQSEKADETTGCEKDQNDDETFSHGKMLAKHEAGRPDSALTDHWW